MEYQHTFDHITRLISGMSVIANGCTGRKHRRSNDDFLPRHAGLIVLFENGSHRLRAGGRLVRRSGEDNRGER